jgi:hypothetical protein
MLVSARLEIVLILTQDRCTVCVKRTIGSEIILDTPIEYLGGVGHVESHFGLFGHNVSVGARLVHGLCQTYYWLRNHFGCTRWFSKVMRLRWNPDSIHLRIVLILTQD